jgi:hypothetical protein
MARERSASMLEVVWRFCRGKSPSSPSSVSLLLGLDSLEPRALWAADLAPVQFTSDPNLEPSQADMPLLVTDPATLPVQIGPGASELVDNPDAGVVPTEPDPSEIPVVVGPGENIPVGITEPLPTAVDIVAGIVGLLARESPFVGNPPEGALPGIPLELVKQSPIPTAVPLIIVRSRPANGTGTAGASPVADRRDDGASLIDELLALDPATRNTRMRELEETLSRWPSDAKAADEGVTQWLRAVETDLINASAEKSLDPEGPASDIHADESEPRLLPQIAALGIMAATWSAPAATKRSRENSRGDRERTPVEYYGTLVSAESFDGATISIQVRDISADGIGILHHGPLPGRRVTVIFGDGSWSQTRRGLVRWTRRLAENVFASGISFHEFR